MTSPGGKENRQSERHMPGEDAQQPPSSPCACASDFTATAAIVSKPENPKQGLLLLPSLPSLLDASRFPTPQGVHVGWDPSHVSTAKCDLCHRQRCGTIQKCRECKLSICNECCLAGRLQGDERHSLDPDAVTWDAPPSSRKRKLNEGHVPAAARKRRGPGRGQGRGRARERAAIDASRSPLAETAALCDPASHDPASRDPASYKPASYDHEMTGSSPRSFRGYGPLEPRYSVAPTSHYHPRGQAQYSDIYRSPRPLQPEPVAMTGSGVNNRDGAPNPRLFPPPGLARYHAEPPRSTYRHIRLLLPAGLQSTDSQTSPSASRGERRYVEPAKRDPDLLDRTRNTHHGPPMPDINPDWPSSSAIQELGIQLSDAARLTKTSNPTLPLDQCLRDEILRTWNAAKFVRMEPDPERAYRLVVGATYFAAICLNLPPHNAARDWLCHQERSLRGMGYEPIKSNPLTSFVRDVAIQYLQQGRPGRKSF